MLSSNNLHELEVQIASKRQLFAIKKLTVGVTSVLISFAFMG